MMKQYKTKLPQILFLFLTLFLILGLYNAPYIGARKKISINAKNITLNINQKKQLKLKNVKTSKTKKIKWYSKNKKIATVSKKGLVKARKVGKTVIYAKYAKKKYSCTVIVKRRNIPSKNNDQSDEKKNQTTELQNSTQDSTAIVTTEVASETTTETTTIETITTETTTETTTEVTTTEATTTEVTTTEATTTEVTTTEVTTTEATTTEATTTEATTTEVTTTEATTEVTTTEDVPEDTEDEPKEIAISASRLNLHFNTREHIYLTNVADDEVLWSSSYTKVATIDSDTNEIIANSVGYAYISTSYNGNTYTCYVTVDSGEDTELYEDGIYTSKDLVAEYIHTYNHLPDNFATKNNVYNVYGKGYSVCTGGDRFYNYEELLPNKSGRLYYECDINTLGRTQRGAERIVYSNDGLIYYTNDHYETFIQLY